MTTQEPLEAFEDSHSYSESPERVSSHHTSQNAHSEAKKARHDTAEDQDLINAQGKEKRTAQAQRHNSLHKDHEAIFEQTMEQTRKEMPSILRPFSRLIHNQILERMSDFAASTIFRPNAILAGGISAFVFVLFIYFYAKFTGFSLSGSETIVSFVIGWAIGQLFDFFKAMFTGRR